MTTANGTPPLVSGGPALRTFDSAIDALSSDLHIARTPEAIRASAVRRTRTPHDVREYLRRISLCPKSSPPGGGGGGSDSAPLLPQNVVHITGTKGKGSTACLCESVLRRGYGLTTGMFTSPHLVDVRERIRINGMPVSKEVFGKAYWTVRERLEKWAEENKTDERGSMDEAMERNEEKEEEASIDDDSLPDLPGYFRMLTIMALFIFAHNRTTDDKKVDVMILEVGMGGRFDATNILDLHQNSGSTEGYNAVAGVTLIDLDHTRVLGTSKAQIAWEKGGIFHADKSEIDAIDDAHCDDERQDFITRRPSSIAEFDVHDLHDSGSSTEEDDKALNAEAGDEKGGSGAKVEEAKSVGVRITPRPPTLSPSSEKKDTTALLEAISGGSMSHSTQTNKKSPSIFFTINSNPPEVLSILRQCARNEGHGRTLEVVRIDDSLDYDDAILPKGSAVGLPGRHQKVNAGLAVEMCRALMAGIEKLQQPGTESDKEKKGEDRLAMALALAFWPGRCQTIAVPRFASKGKRAMNVRLDGAHTPQSMGTCLEWFRAVSGECPRSRRVLVFYCGHERNPVPLLRLLQNRENEDEQEDPCPSKNLPQAKKEKALPLFEHIYFCRPDSERPSAISPLSASELLSDAGVTIKHATEVSVDDNGVANEGGGKTWQETLADVWSALERIECGAGSDEQAAQVVSGLTVEQAMDKIKKDLNISDQINAAKVRTSETAEVLVTGSLYVVGSALKALGWEEEEAKGHLNV